MKTKVFQEPLAHEEYEAGGMTVIKEYGQIVAVKNLLHRVQIGQKVISNGRMLCFAEKGLMGIVTDIKEPDAAGRTDNVIDVWFEGNIVAHAMQFKDLQF